MKKMSIAMSDNVVEYNNFIESLKIENITIPSINWCLIKNPGSGEKMLTQAKLSIVDPVIKRKSEITIPANLEVIGYIEKTPKNKFMSINVSVNLTIKVSPKVFSKELLDKYIQRNAIFTLISIFREQVRNATFQMGLPPLILPAFKLSPSQKKEEVKIPDNITSSQHKPIS